METEQYKDTPQKIFDIADDCYKEYASGEMGDGVYMASGSVVSDEFISRCKKAGYDTHKFNIPEIALLSLSNFTFHSILKTSSHIIE